MTSALDEGIGNITSALEARGMFEDTIIIFSSDNGGSIAIPHVGIDGFIEKAKQMTGLSMANCIENGEVSWGQDTGATNYPLRGSMGSLHEGAVRVPGIIHYPRKIQANTTFDSKVGNQSLAET